MSKFAYVWEYLVKPEALSDFESAYGPEGDWVRLFSKDADYHGTRLYRDDSKPNRFITIDYWTSRSARDAFRNAYRAEFDAIDRRCDAFTESETFLGDFQNVSSSQA